MQASELPVISLEQDKKDSRLIQQEFTKLGEILEQDYIIQGPQKKKKIKRKDAVEKLTQKVARFKKVHSGCESDLGRILAKVDLDKFILLKERLTCVWNEELYNRLGDLNIKQDLRKLKA